ncbi:hypothetical protein KL921_001911 [Ogataea angusta]|uniref:Mediator of RNA polymerase II transcription subunit 4 n=1 Tax=Pichia angusta TaxID=870730 RepID=A0AAN6DG57_PICAN|nr:uncharacterized protein KL928_002095 [Ogataea angusta]KAG7811645.1 hypothetical protein KL921_001911 [Ogataea angusta]KAG7819421.1 hypothetical protein KL928_002095 [Ogataea angusta]KAG7824202.1 hypothetical protein KL909_002200 [Ogataea angusta]KAG7831005.1 hypothetical protein KL920_001596 [Ogataea angusta]KAG7835226.1 hypothetical protein KL943_002541 [Ogataea angusta]
MTSASNKNTFIYQQVDAFEGQLREFTNSIQQYEPSVEVAAKLVATMDTINDELTQLERLHELKRNQVFEQSKENLRLNDGMRNMLTSLIECRKELNDLPKLSTHEQLQLENSDEARKPKLDAVKELVAYAMKLAKFSKIPRTFDGFLLPNNFIWPGDDNMRRGMLATASLMPEKIVRYENGEPDEQEDIQMKDTEETQKPEVEDDDEFVPERRNSFKTSASPEKKDAAEIMAGIDLFDESDDD